MKSLRDTCTDALESVQAGHLSFDEQVAEDCLGLAETIDCSGAPPFNVAKVRDRCSAVFAGTVTSGQTCHSSLAEFVLPFDECDGGYCQRPSDECTGTCVAFLQEGNSCVEDRECGPDLICQSEQCSAPGALGESCENARCDVGLSCLGSPLTCHYRGQPGELCSDEDDCALEAVCDDGRCAADRALGQSCRAESNCEGESYCRIEPPAELGSCTSTLANGSACEIFERCELGYQCGAGEPQTCQLEYAAKDEPCGPFGCQDGLWCSDEASFPGVCLEQASVDEACASPDSCLPGSFCGPDEKCHPFEQPLGEPCLVFDVTCAQGLFCDRETETCQARRDDGQTCNPRAPTDSCRDGLFCACLSSTCPAVSSGHSTDDVCQAQKENGQDCTEAYECAAGRCDDDGKCAAPLPDPEPLQCSR